MAKKKTESLQRDAIVTEARVRFELAREHWNPIYEECRKDMRFSDPTNPQQWPEQAKRERESAGRPCLTFDQTSQFVRQVINTARRNKPALNFLPVDDKSDPKLAEVLKGLARQTEHASRAEVAYITALNHATRGGIGWFRLVLKDVKSDVQGQKCAEITRVVDFRSVLVDPTFIEPDGSDMQWGFVYEDVPRDKFEREHPDAEPIPWDDAHGWGTKDTIRVADYYRVVRTDDGAAVEQYKLSGEGVLDKTIFPAEHVPLFPVLGNEEWDEGKRRLSGCVRLAKDAQVSYNFERNAQYEAVAVGPKAPWLAPAEAIEGHEDKWRKANAANTAYLPFNTFDENGNPIPHKPERISPAGIATGWAQLAQNSKDDIQAALGGFETGVGNNPNDQSGRAVLALQDRQDVGTFHYIDNLALSIAHCGRVLTQVWPVIYDQEQVLRILGEDDEPSFVTVDPTLERGYAERMSPMGQQVIAINPGVGKYDVRATVGPAFATKQQEFAAELGEVISGNPQILTMVGDMWVKARNFPDADKLARRFKAMLPPQIQQAEGDAPQQLPPEAVQALQAAQNEIQALQQQLAEAQQGMQAEMIRAQTQLAIARENNDAKRDVEELKGMVQLLLQQMQPPPMLAAEVAGDMTQQ
jgi:hypothetical protein